MVFALTAYTSVAAATGTLMPPKVETAFDPNMNGYYEDIEADNGNIYTTFYTIILAYEGDWVNNVKQGQGTHTYFDETGKLFGTYVGAFSSDKRNGEGVFTYESGYVQDGTWKNDNFMEWRV